jgi:endonuclease/exonuclease/phosphatase family metal-dependent hydrolase
MDMNKLLLSVFLLLLIACTSPITESPEPPELAASSTPASTAVPSTAPSETSISPATQLPTEAGFVLPEFSPFPRPDMGALVIDGEFEDWAAFEPIFVDASGDAGFSGIDLTEIYAAHTDTHLLLKVSLGKVVNLQTEQALHLSLEHDGDVYSFNFGTRIGRINGDSARQADLGLFSLPTVTSDEFEVVFPIQHTGGDLTVLFSDPNDDGDLASADDEPIAYGWNNYIDTASSRPLDRPDGTLRVLSWNVLRDNIFDINFEPHFARVLQALQPDVILIQEIYTFSDKTALNHITEWLGGEWFAKQQGDLVTVSRYPFIEDWRDSNHNLRARIFPTLLDVDGLPFLVFNAHLSCCDRDQDRQDEVDSFIGFLREVGLVEGLPFLLAGDLNLVGDAQQLTTLLTGDIIDESKFGADYSPDWDGSALADLLPGHTHSNFTFTWNEGQSSFPPGRLDFMIYSDSVINAQGFVLDTTELSEADLRAYDLLAEDTAEASDHLPLVVDLVLLGHRP